MKLLSVSLVAAAACWPTVFGERLGGIIARQDSTSAVNSAASCPVKKIRKTFEWSYSLPPWPFAKPRYYQYQPLETEGSGWVWIDNSADTADYVSRPILFENGQGWEVVNCTWKYASTDPLLGGCNGSALLNTPGTNIGDAPPDKGKIGTLSALPLGGVSPWSIYDLVSFKLTPIVDSKFYKEQITVEVFGWHDDGSKVDTMRFKIKGSEIGYTVSLPKGWDKIIQWQVRVWWSDGSAKTRQDFPFLIDSTVTDEYDVPTTTSSTRCQYLTETPISTPTAVTLKFDDIAASPTGTLPVPYHSYTFSSNWVVTNAKSYPKGSPGLNSTTSGSNALYASGANGPDYQITGDNFLFDTEGFHITIDPTTTNATNAAPLQLIIKPYGSCLDSQAPPGFLWKEIQVNSTSSYSFDVDTKTLGGFLKMRRISITVYDVNYNRVPFWIDGLVVKSWEDGLKGISGCKRCSSGSQRAVPLSYFCEYPGQMRG